MYKILVDSAYRILLNREPDQEGADFWINKLEDGSVEFLYEGENTK